MILANMHFEHANYFGGKCENRWWETGKSHTVPDLLQLHLPHILGCLYKVQDHELEEQCNRIYSYKHVMSCLSLLDLTLHTLHREMVTN
jgi:hypothetical protein